MVAVDDSVMAHDICEGLPFDDGTFDVVYHSHVLEHLSPVDGESLVSECHRVLRPGGVLRMVVPDLERIAELYLQMLRKAWHRESSASDNYAWMKLELLDQMVRKKSGGLMGPYMIDYAKSNREFVEARVGREIDSCEPVQMTGFVNRTGWARRMRDRFHNARLAITRHTIRLLMGSEYASAFDEGVFRQQGEIHRWMYDRFSLRQLVEGQGFTGFTVCQADESQIECFADFQLDVAGSKARKPDSLFVECQKTAMVAAKAA